MTINEKMKSFVSRTVDGAALFDMYPNSSENIQILTNEERIIKAWNMTGMAMRKAIHEHSSKAQ